jgi:hypothetical protein
MGTWSVVGLCLGAAVGLFLLSIPFNPTAEREGTTGYAIGRTIQLLILFPLMLLVQHLYVVLAHWVEYGMSGNYVRGGTHHVGTLFPMIGALLVPTVVESMLLGGTVESLGTFVEKKLSASPAVALGIPVATWAGAKAAAYYGGLRLGVETSPWWPVLAELPGTGILPFFYVAALVGISYSCPPARAPAAGEHRAPFVGSVAHQQAQVGFVDLRWAGDQPWASLDDDFDWTIGSVEREHHPLLARRPHQRQVVPLEPLDGSELGEGEQRPLLVEQPDVFAASGEDDGAADRPHLADQDQREDETADAAEEPQDRNRDDHHGGADANALRVVPFAPDPEGDVDHRRDSQDQRGERQEGNPDRGGQYQCQDRPDAAVGAAYPDFERFDRDGTALIRAQRDFGGPPEPGQRGGARRPGEGGFG